MRMLLLVGVWAGASLGALAVSAAAEPTRDTVRAALDKAIAFFHGQVARRGGYVYAQSADLKLREGEGVVLEDTIWVQPPGTPEVGAAYLDVYAVTGDSRHLAAARAAGEALLLGQLESGGWNYRIDFAPAEREKWFYRCDLSGRMLPPRVSDGDRQTPVGWDDWKRRKYRGNLTILDDDTTQSAIRFLARLDRALDFRDARIRDATVQALQSVCRAQYPNGAWSASYDRFPAAAPPEGDYPVAHASYPESWSRSWPKDFAGCYVTNDNLIATMIETLLLAHEIYGRHEYLVAAKRAGEFFIAAQMPDPQPAWAQQYDRQMHPCWSRAFEPPAITGGESQAILQALMVLYRHTGERKFLEPIPAALAYLRRSELPDGRLARFYELRTNRPIYFTRGSDGRHEMTYSDERIAEGYSYVVEAKLPALEATYRRLLAASPAEFKVATPGPQRLTKSLVQQAATLLDSLDARGAWVEPGRLRHHKVAPPGGVINSETFCRNVRVLCAYLRAAN